MSVASLRRAFEYPLLNLHFLRKGTFFSKLVNIKFKSHLFFFFLMLRYAQDVLRKGCLPSFFYSLIAEGNADRTDFPYQTQVDFGISNRALTHKQMYDFSVPFLRTNASFEIIARERQPIRWPCCVVPWTSAADWSKDKSLGPLDVEGEKEARSWVSPLKHCSAAETLAVVLGTHFSKREWNISPWSMSQLILRVFLNSEQISVSGHRLLLLWDHGKGWRWGLTPEHNSPSPQPIPATDSHLEQEEQTRPQRATSPPLMVSPFISFLNQKLACTLTGPFTAT